MISIYQKSDTPEYTISKLKSLFLIPNSLFLLLWQRSEKIFCVNANVSNTKIDSQSYYLNYKIYKTFNFSILNTKY